MSKAEDLAYKAYPYNGDYRGQGDSNSNFREAYIKGYQQAEKDLELTWEDMSFIRLVFDAIEANIHLGGIKIQPMTKEYYQEVLKQFKNLKNDIRRH